MVILGVTAMPKSGKGELSDALKNHGWIHISMSGLLKKQIMKDTGLRDEEVTRSIMFQQGANYRKHYGGGYAARLCLEEIDKRQSLQTEKFIIDGIRHPGEINVLNKLNGISGNVVNFVGIIADENRKKDKEIRRLRLAANPDQRGENYEDVKIFDWIDYYEWKMPPHGLQVGPCLKLVRKLPNGRILMNDKGIVEWKRKIEGYAVELEGNHVPVEGRR